MKNYKRVTKVVLGLVALISVLIIACSKDFEDIILDDFDFNFSIEQPETSFVFESAKTIHFYPVDYPVIISRIKSVSI